MIHDRYLLVGQQHVFMSIQDRSNDAIDSDVYIKKQCCIYSGSCL